MLEGLRVECERIFFVGVWGVAGTWPTVAGERRHGPASPWIVRMSKSDRWPVGNDLEINMSI